MHSFLKVLGIEVDQINSVQLSNHTGYKIIKGQILSEKELGELFDGLVGNNLHELYTHLVTGYVGNENFLREIKRIIKRLRECNPSIVYGRLMCTYLLMITDIYLSFLFLF